MVRVTLVYVYGLETMAMRGKQEKVQVCGINYGSQKSGQVKNGLAGGGAEGRAGGGADGEAGGGAGGGADGGAGGGAGRGAWCETEFHEEAGEELK